MPITSIGTHLTTAQQIHAHWTDVNADRLALTLPELKLQGGYLLALFTTDYNMLQSAVSGMEGFENARVLAAGDRDAQKENLRERVLQFRAAGRLHFKLTPYFAAIPTVPRFGSSESKFLRPLDNMADLWTRINADTGIIGFTGPLRLKGGYTLAGFTSELDLLRTTFREVTDAENDLDMARRQRDKLLDPLRERMLQYCLAIELEYGKGHPFFESLPDLYPAAGSTPNPVTASGHWDVMTFEAVIQWTASADSHLDHYSIRMCPEGSYDTDSESVIGTVPLGTTEFRTIAGLEGPGDVASFRVYVVLDTGNEAGSNTVVITRA